MPAYTPVAAAPSRQLLTHVEDACHIGTESIDLLAALLYAIERCASQPDTPAASHTQSLLLIAEHLMENYRTTLDAIREDSHACAAKQHTPFQRTPRRHNA